MLFSQTLQLKKREILTYYKNFSKGIKFISRLYLHTIVKFCKKKEFHFISFINIITSYNYISIYINTFY